MVQTTTRHPAVPVRTAAWPRPVLVIAGAVVLALVATASRYGYHRDELYFLAAGHHLAWGYADQGPLTPLVARAMTAIAPGSLTVLRLPSAVIAGIVVMLTARTARELGGSARAQAIAAACCATSVLVLFDGHLLSTSTPDLLVWTAVPLLVLRARRQPRLWLAVGAVLGVGLLNKPLPAFLAAALVAGLLLTGQRSTLRNRWPWLGALLALALWSPWLVWQARHGWPQLTVARSIAAGGSTSSQPWWLVVPFQPLLAGPVLAPVWIAGLVRLWRDHALRFLAVAWAVLAVTFMVAGGKPYYLGGLLPLLIAAGAAPTDRWLGQRRRFRGFAWVAALSAVVCGTIALPLLPVTDAGLAVAANADVGETIGWPGLVHTVAGVYRTAGPDAVILAENYGEAGAVDRYGPGLGLPQAYSGHNAFGYWGHPADGTGRVVVIGYSLEQAQHWLTGCRQAAKVHVAAGIDNQENGGPVLVCAGPRTSWSQEWASIRHLG